MIQLFRITIHWTNQFTTFELRHLEGHQAKSIYKNLDMAMADKTVVNIYSNGIDYLINTNNISYVEYFKDVLVEEK